ncbi:hypothetical protein OH76DRAFT_1041840 [Lentinus brumalis]|uniref:Secreted protein n=1 Tax=Lentinus brumalis TaxID=2498619 RepID=A0A371CX35_9APHY|nr:hypothetical protein OH76DRAFT_1041840 [Polyporus brumalis]
MAGVAVQLFVLVAELGVPRKCPDGVPWTDRRRLGRPCISGHVCSSVCKKSTPVVRRPSPHSEMMERVYLPTPVVRRPSLRRA